MLFRLQSLLHLESQSSAAQGPPCPDLTPAETGGNGPPLRPSGAGESESETQTETDRSNLKEAHLTVLTVGAQLQGLGDRPSPEAMEGAGPTFGAQGAGPRRAGRRRSPGGKAEPPGPTDCVLPPLCRPGPPLARSHTNTHTHTHTSLTHTPSYTHTHSTNTPLTHSHTHSFLHSHSHSTHTHTRHTHSFHTHTPSHPHTSHPSHTLTLPRTLILPLTQTPRHTLTRCPSHTSTAFTHSRTLTHSPLHRLAPSLTHSLSLLLLQCPRSNSLPSTLPFSSKSFPLCSGL